MQHSQTNFSTTTHRQLHQEKRHTKHYCLNNLSNPSKIMDLHWVWNRVLYTPKYCSKNIILEHVIIVDMDYTCATAEEKMDRASMRISHGDWGFWSTETMVLMKGEFEGGADVKFARSYRLKILNYSKGKQKYFCHLYFYISFHSSNAPVIFKSILTFWKLRRNERLYFKFSRKI